MSTFLTIAELMAERLEIDIERIQPQTELESLGADSLTLIELIFDLEDKFHTSFGNERPKLVNVQDIVDHVDRHLLQQAIPL